MANEERTDAWLAQNVGIQYARAGRTFGRSIGSARAHVLKADHDVTYNEP